MRHGVKNEGTLAAVAGFTQQARSEMHAQFHRHIESRRAIVGKFNPRQIMDAPVAFPDQPGDLAHPHFCPVR